MIRTTLIGLTGAIALATAANAADIYSGGGLKDGPVALEANTWTGFYVGVGGGGGAVNHDINLTQSFTYFDYPTETTSADLNGIGGDGAFGTVEVGYDRQFGRFVGGIFFNYDFTDISSQLKLSSPFNSVSASYDLDSMWSVGGRLGYLVNPSTLAYVLGAYTEASFSASSLLKSAGIGDHDYSGFTVGGGLETKLGGNWFLKAEYRFTSLDKETLFSASSISECCTSTFRVTDEADIHQGRVVLSYKFNSFGSDYTPMK